MKKQGFTTKAIHVPFLKNDSHNALQMPIYSNAAFEFETAAQMEQAFLGRVPDHTYSRVSNPTVENLEQRIAAITGALAVTAMSSGMAAISNTFLTLSQAGDNIITSSHLFGNTYSFFDSTLRAFGVEARFCDLTDPSDVLSKIDSRTVAIFLETITNPQLEVADLSLLSEVARKHNIVLVADSTISPPNIFRAVDFGVDIEVISSTKSISGGATSIGGLIIDYGSFDWQKNKKLEALALKFGPFAFNAKLRKEIFKNLGACLSPYHAYFQSLGLETLVLRYDKAVANCLAIAGFLQNEKSVAGVNYPGLKGSKYYDLCRKQFDGKPGAVLTFELQSKEACYVFLDKLKIIRRATNLYDNRSLIIHPASTIFCEYNPEKRLEISVPDTLIRLSVGIEDIEDLLEDFETALKN
jgi:O-acetylhomoserine (thiol)-lyase